MLLSKDNRCLCIIELTVGFETNFKRNAQHKKIKNQPLLEHFTKTCHKVKFIDLSTSSLGIFGQDSESFLTCAKC